jgi:microcystin-dependent protein
MPAPIWATAFRDQLPTATADQFDYLFAALKQFFNVSFNEDGTLIQPAPGANLVPLGSINLYAGSTAPPGWLLCDGSAINRVFYKDLFNTIGVTYGGGDGSTTFNLPNLQQRFPLGKAISGTGATLGSTGGAIDHAHSLGAITISGSTGSSGVSISGSTSTDGSHSHSGSTGSESSHTHSITVPDQSTGVASTGITVNLATGAIPETIPGHTHDVPSQIFTSGSGSSHSHSISSDGSHSHTAGSLAGAAHTHSSGTLSASGANTGTANPPYQVVNYIILAQV